MRHFPTAHDLVLGAEINFIGRVEGSSQCMTLNRAEAWFPEHFMTQFRTIVKTVSTICLASTEDMLDNGNPRCHMLLWRERLHDIRAQ